MFKSRFIPLAIATLITTTSPLYAKDLSDIDVGDNVCWDGVIFNSYGRVISKNYSNRTIYFRSESGRHDTVPATEISGVWGCKIEDKLLEEAVDQFFDALTKPSEDKEDQ